MNLFDTIRKFLPGISSREILGIILYAEAKTRCEVPQIYSDTDHVIRCLRMIKAANISGYGLCIGCFKKIQYPEVFCDSCASSWRAFYTARTLKKKG